MTMSTRLYTVSEAEKERFKTGLKDLMPVLFYILKTGLEPRLRQLIFSSNINVWVNRATALTANVGI